MKVPQKIDPIRAAAALAGWSPVDGRAAISKTFRFADFSSAFGWMTRVAMAAEAADHHPEWANVYSKVDVVLTTHDAGGVTSKDTALARFMNAAATEAAAD